MLPTKGTNLVRLCGTHLKSNTTIQYIVKAMSSKNFLRKINIQYFVSSINTSNLYGNIGGYCGVIICPQSYGIPLSKKYTQAIQAVAEISWHLPQL